MKLVISAVNFTDGGPLTVLRDAVDAAVAFDPAWTVYVLVHRPGLIDASRAIELPFPQAKRSWLRRVKCEWFDFLSLSRELAPDVWLSLHDMTPRVEAGRQYVYCHNPVPFCRERVEDGWRDPKFLLFRTFYSWLYRCFIHRNAAVIVQQEWLRAEFRRRFGVKRVVVAHPVESVDHTGTRSNDQATIRSFVYPALPRIFKNFDILGRAVRLLEQDPRWHGVVRITIDGTENAYARRMRQRYGSLRSLEFVGLQSRERMEALYRDSDALLFPSLLETWGLPLTEAKRRRLPILAADLPYARESIGTYDRVDFFDPHQAADLAALMLRRHCGTERFGTATQPLPAEPYVSSWKALFALISADDEVAAARRPGREEGWV